MFLHHFDVNSEMPCILSTNKNTTLIIFRIRGFGFLRIFVPSASIGAAASLRFNHLRTRSTAAAMNTAVLSHPASQFTVSPYLCNHYFPSSAAYVFLNTHLRRTTLSSSSSPKVLSRPSSNTFSCADGSDIGEGDSSGGIVEKLNRGEALGALAEVSRSLSDIPDDLAVAIKLGKIPAMVVHRYFDLENSPVLGWLLRFGGFKERLLADDLFLTKVAIECGVGIFTKTAAELAGRQENFTKELDFVFADLAMAIIADFMLVWLPAPTVSLRPPVSVNAGCLNKFFYACPDNAFQVTFAGMSYSLLQRIGAIMRNGGKLFVVGTGASLIGTGLTVMLIAARIAIDASFDGETNDLPILSTSVAYGVFMAVSSNLRYQILAGVIEQRILEPLFLENKLILGATCFAIRTGNTFLGSLMWVAYAHWIGIQTINE